MGEIYGVISGWGFFVFWMGIWVSPQPRFTIPVFQNPIGFVPVINFPISVLHFLICMSFLVPGAWLAIGAVKETTVKVAETHRTEIIITAGAYSIVRHPQYLGGLLAHAGISVLFSAWYSLLFTPLMVVVIYVISRKEEEELIREFGKEYEDYRNKVPMLIPELRAVGL